MGNSTVPWAEARGLDPWGEPPHHARDPRCGRWAARYCSPWPAPIRPATLPLHLARRGKADHPAQHRYRNSSRRVPAGSSSRRSSPDQGKAARFAHWARIGAAFRPGWQV